MSWLTKSTEERQRHIGGFIAMTRTLEDATRVLRKRYMSWHTAPQGNCAFIVGITNTGKTTAIDEFMAEIRDGIAAQFKDGNDLVLADEEAYPPTMSVAFERPGQGVVRPVIKVFVGKRVTFNNLLWDTLLALGIKAPKNATYSQMMTMIRTQIREQEVKLLIFDECQHICEGRTQRGQYDAGDVFKLLMKDARVEIACAGLPHATEMLDANTQLAKLVRAKLTIQPFPLALEPESGWIVLLATMSADLPFDKPSDLHSRPTALRLHLATEGLIGHVCALVMSAAVDAMTEGEDHVSMTRLAATYREETGVPDDENPFLMPRIDARHYNALVARKRRERLDAAEARQSGNRPGKSKAAFGARGQ